MHVRALRGQLLPRCHQPGPRIHSAQARCTSPPHLLEQLLAQQLGVALLGAVGQLKLALQLRHGRQPGSGGWRSNSIWEQ